VDEALQHLTVGGDHFWEINVKCIQDEVVADDVFILSIIKADHYA
jgi:hypothetical protein